jgi:hypothetical protein
MFCLDKCNMTMNDFEGIAGAILKYVSVWQESSTDYLEVMCLEMAESYSRAEAKNFWAMRR